YFYRLRDSIEEDYPGVLAVVGADEFQNLITDYLLAHPSTHWSLRYAGQHLPSFLRAHRLAQDRPWLVALAQLEWTLLDAFDAADSPVLAASDLEGLAPESWASIGFVPTPSVRLLELDWEVDELRDRARHGENPGDAKEQASTLLIWRRELRVYHRPLTGVERDCARLVLAGKPFVDWCEHAADRCGEEAAAQVAPI